MQISCSILSSDNREASVQKLNNTNVDYLHIDVMDGKFVKNTQFPISEIKKMLSLTTKKADIHLMVENPLVYIKELRDQNISYITIHRELDTDLYPIIDEIKKLNYQVGLSIKPDTSVASLIPYLKDIDLILVMSVEPGYGKQIFLPRTINKLNELNRLRTKYPHLIVEVDGGINDTNIKKLVKAKVDISVVGSYITNNDDYDLCINKLKGTK